MSITVATLIFLVNIVDRFLLRRNIHQDISNTDFRHRLWLSIPKGENKERLVNVIKKM